MTVEVGQPGQADQFFEELLQECKPVEIVKVDTAAGKVLTFKQLMSGHELAQFKKRAARFVKMARSSPAKEWAGLVPKENELIGQVFMIHDRSYQPKIPLFYAFKIVDETPYLVEQIANELALSSALGLQKRIEEEMEKEGNESEGLVFEEM